MQTKNIKAGQTTTNRLRILSIDGGGVRGIIPARILKELEIRTGKSTYELFNIGTGTSTGALIVLGLAAPSFSGFAKHTTQDLIDLYLKDAKDIFSKTLLRKIKTGFGLWGSKYSRSNLDKIAGDMFGKLKLSQTLYPVYIPIYSLLDSKPYILSTKAALQDKKNDFYVKDIAGATTAAPTYFPPKIMTNIQGNLSYTAADGGIYVNKPEIIASMCVADINQEFNVEDVLLLSIGTGRVEHTINKVEGDDGIMGWLKDKNLISDMMSAEMSVDEIIAGSIFKSNRYRLEVGLQPGMDSMDNANESNLNSLLNATEDFIEKNSVMLDEICAKLTSSLKAQESTKKAA